MAPVPAIAHNPRLRSILLAWTFLVVALYTLSKGSEHTSGSDGVGEAAMRMLKQPVWHGGQDAQRARALRWKQDRPVNVEKWEEESLNRWRDSPDMVSDPYDTETNHRPHNGSYTAAVIYLTRISRIRETLASLESLARYMPMEQAYSFILVHSGDLAGLAAQQEVLSRWNERIEELHQAGEVTLGSKMKVMAEGMEFLKIDMDAPVEVQRKGMEAWDDVVFGGDTWPGYHSMCRFFAVDIFWNHQIRQFDYYMRMDTDSYILTPMHSDPFRRIRASGASYAYRQPGGDPEYVVKGLPDYIEAYMDAHEHDPGAAGMRQRVDNSRLIESARHEREGGMAAYYNNWEIAHVPSFRRPGVRDWLVGLAGNDEGFYRYRWGDAPLRYATIQMFFEEHEYERYCDFAYYHQFIMREGELVMTDPGPTWKCPEH